MATLKVPELKVPDLPHRVGDLGGYLREQRESARLSLRQLASAAGVSNPYLSQIERGLRRPSAEVLQQIAKGLQISAEALYLRAGILEEHAGVQVDVAVHGDAYLTARQKRVLLDIYATFRAENARAGQEAPAAAEPDPQALPETRSAPARKRAAATADTRSGRRTAAARPPAAKPAATKRASTKKAATKQAASGVAAARTAATTAAGKRSTGRTTGGRAGGTRAARKGADAAPRQP